MWLQLLSLRSKHRFSTPCIWTGPVISFALKYVWSDGVELLRLCLSALLTSVISHWYLFPYGEESNLVWRKMRDHLEKSPFVWAEDILGQPTTSQVSNGYKINKQTKQPNKYSRVAYLINNQMQTYGWVHPKLEKLPKWSVDSLSNINAYCYRFITQFCFVCYCYYHNSSVYRNFLICFLCS